MLNKKEKKRIKYVLDITVYKNGTHYNTKIFINGKEKKEWNGTPMEVLDYIFDEIRGRWYQRKIK